MKIYKVLLLTGIVLLLLGVVLMPAGYGAGGGALAVIGFLSFVAGRIAKDMQGYGG
jgi:hypothetical protein